MIRLMYRYLRPYSRLLGVLVILQAVQAIANLYLPNLNASDHRQGRPARGHGLHLETRRVHARGHGLPGGVRRRGVYLGSRVAMGFGRDVREGCSIVRSSFSSREVNHFGPSSLITRVTNDVQQVQMLVVMACTFLLAAPMTIIGGVIMALHQNVGLAWLLGASMPLPGRLPRRS